MPSFLPAKPSGSKGKKLLEGGIEKFRRGQLVFVAMTGPSHRELRVAQDID